MTITIMSFPSTTVLLILLAIWIMVVAEVFRAVCVYTSQVNLVSPHLAPMPTNDNCYESEGAMFLCMVKDAAAASATTIVEGQAYFMQPARSQMLFSSACERPMTSRAFVFDDMLATIPSGSAIPRPAVCHPDTHDAVDLWDGQWGTVVGELSLGAKQVQVSPGARVGDGFREIERAVYTCTGRVLSTVERWVAGAVGTMKGWHDGAVGTNGGWYDDALGTIKRWCDDAVGAIKAWCSSAFDGVRNTFSPTPTPPSPPPLEPASPASKSFWNKALTTEQDCCQACSELHREMQPWWKRTWSAIVEKGNEKLPPPVPQAKPSYNRDLKSVARKEGDNNIPMKNPLFTRHTDVREYAFLCFLAKLSLVMNVGLAPATPKPPPPKDSKQQGWWSKLAGELKDGIIDPT